MNALNNNFDPQPHAHFEDATNLAQKRLKRSLGAIVDWDDKILEQLLHKTFLQTDTSGRSVIRHDTGTRIVTTTPVEIIQSIVQKDLRDGWHFKLLAIPHPIYAPNRPMWLSGGTALFRNTWQGSKIAENVPSLPKGREELLERPEQWQDFLFRLFYGDLPTDNCLSGSEKSNFNLEKVNTESEDRIRFMWEFDLWLAFSLFSTQRPRWSPVLRGAHGTGKGTVEKHVIQPFVGKSNHIKVLPHNIKGDHGAQFLTEKCMVVFDEVNDRGSAFYDRLKNMTTEDDLAVNPKHLAPYVDDAVFSTLILSNEEVPMAFPEGERRWLVSPYMTHKEDQTDTAAWLYGYFVPWLTNEAGYSKLGLYLKSLVATKELPSVAWKSPWFFEICKTETAEDHASAIMTWLQNQDDHYGYTITGLSNYFKAGQGIVKKCLCEAGYSRGKVNGTNINVWKKKGCTGELHHHCSKLG